MKISNWKELELTLEDWEEKYDYEMETANIKDEKFGLSQGSFYTAKHFLEVVVAFRIDKIKMDYCE